MAGICLIIISQFTDLFYYFDENNLYHRNALFPLGVALGLLPGLITLTVLLQNKKKLQTNAFVSLLLYFALPLIGVILILISYGFSWINIGLGLGALHLFYSSMKLMELEFYSGDRAQTIISPVYKTENALPETNKRVRRNHFWQTLSISLGGILVVLLIVSIKGIALPEKTLAIDSPYTENDSSKSVCITFVQNAEKHWIDGEDPDRTGAQYDGIIYNNMSSTIITD